MPGITVSRILLGEALMAARVSARISRKAAASAAGCSLSHVGHLETGRNAPTTEEQLLKLARLYRIPDETLDELRQLWLDASKPGWWSIYGLPPDYARYVGLETDAETLLTWSPLNIPGLLQTERYMRHKYELDAPSELSSREIDKRVLTRLNRQHRITGSDNPLRLEAVITEGAVLRALYTSDVGAPQLHQLVQRASLSNVEIRILLTATGMTVGQDGAFALLTFPHQLLPPVIYQELPTGSDQTGDIAVGNRLHTVFSKLRRQALDPIDSLAWLTQLAENHIR